MIGELLAPLFFIGDPAKRLYWACLFSALILASLVLSLEAKQFNFYEQLRRLFNPAYWLQRTCAIDVGYMFLNNALRVLVLLPIIGSHLWLTLETGRFLQSELGDAPALGLPWFMIATLYAMTFLVAEDGSRFGLHYLMHRVPVLWKLHRVHHSATTLTPLTLFRVHPLEAVLYFFRGSLVFGLVSGFFIWMFGRELSTFHILGVDLLGFIFNAAGANLRHSHIWLSFGYAEKWFISPAQHQLHHSISHGHVNLGTYLACWDRMLGTHRRAQEKEQLIFGVLPSNS